MEWKYEIKRINKIQQFIKKVTGYRFFKIKIVKKFPNLLYFLNLLFLIKIIIYHLVIILDCSLVLFFPKWDGVICCC